MTERLGRKLGMPVTAASHGVRPAHKACFIVDEKYSFTCEFQQADGTAWVLPYALLNSVELAADSAVLTIAFTSHSVRVDGARLHRIKDALARGQNLLIRAVEPRWKADYANDEVFVSAIQLTERNEREPPEEDEAPK